MCVKSSKHITRERLIAFAGCRVKREVEAGLGPAATTAHLVERQIGCGARQPRTESPRVARRWATSLRSEEGLLQDVLGCLGLAKDRAGAALQRRSVLRVGRFKILLGFARPVQLTTFRRNYML